MKINKKRPGFACFFKNENKLKSKIISKLVERLRKDSHDQESC